MGQKNQRVIILFSAHFKEPSKLWGYGISFFFSLFKNCNHKKERSHKEKYGPHDIRFFLV